MPAPVAPVPRAVFLSYTSEDIAAARRVCEALRSGGVDVWFDQEGGLEHGDEWDAKIRRQIKECVFFVPLISARTQARIEGYFRIEWDLAAERARGIAQGVPFILPVTIDDTTEATALVPERFRKVQWMHVPDGKMSPDVRARLLKLWSQRTGATVPEMRAIAPTVTDRPSPAALAPPPRAAQPVALAAPEPARPARPAPPSPAPPTSPAANGPTAPKISSRFDNLEIGSRKVAATPALPAKDEAHYLAEADNFYYSGRYDLALRSYSKILEHNAANHGAWLAQVRMLIELEELREARLWVDKALERFTDHPELLAAKAVAHAHMGKFDEALAFSDAAVEERGNTPYVWLARGDVLLGRGEAKASYCFDQAMTLARHDWARCWEAARIHHFYRNYPLALRYAQQACEHAPTRAVAWLQAGRAQLRLGLGARASESLTQVQQLDPNCPGLTEALMEAERISPGSSVWRRLKGLFS